MKNTIKNLLLLLWGIATAIAVAETALFMLDMPRFYQRHTAPPQFTFFKEVGRYANIGYLNLPNRTIQYIYDGNPRGYFGKDNEVNHTTNSLGFRSRQVLPEKDETTFRIVILGDSFTFGEGVRDDDTYAMQIEKVLAARFPHVKVQSLNFGVGGYNTTQEAEMLRLFGLSVKPDLVVLGYSANDAHPALFDYDPVRKNYVRRTSPLTQLATQPTRPPDNFLYNNSRIAQLIWSVASTRKKKDAILDIYRSMFRDDYPGWIESKRALGAIGKMCQENALPCFAVLFPNLAGIADYPLQQEHNLILDALNKNEFTVIDMLPALKALKVPDKDLWVHPTDHHPNEMVHRRVAELVSDQIVRSNLLERYKTDSRR